MYCCGDKGVKEKSRTKPREKTSNNRSLQAKGDQQNKAFRNGDQGKGKEKQPEKMI